VTFDHILLVWLAPAVALGFFGLGAWARTRRVRHARRWSRELARTAAANGRWTPLTFGLAALCIALALAGPRWGSRVVTTETKALNVVFAVDISRSMLAEDVAPSRLERAKREARRLVHDLAGDRIGLIAFAGGSYILTPLTVDGSAVELLLDALDPGIASSGGTEMSRALRQGRDLLFGAEDVADRVLVVFTDGETHDTLPAVLSAATRLGRDGVRLILVAEGGREPVPIPIRSPAGELLGYQRDPMSVVVQTSRRDDVLSQVADAAHGVVVAADLEDQAGTVRELVADYQRAPQSATTTRRNVSRAWVPALVALLLLLGQTMTRRTLALAGFALMVGARAAQAQGPVNSADAAWRRGAFREAAREYLAQVQRGEGGDTTWLNLGTAALAVGDTTLAHRALARAAQSLEPEVRFRGLYNLGLLELRLAKADSARQREHLDAALRHYRAALSLKPGSDDARWNFELAIRRLPPPPSGGGAGGGGGGREPPQEPPPPTGMSVAQARQLLASIAEAERETRRQQARRNRQAIETRGRREW
jgi:Ca-activated chloride channel family protein